MQLGLVVLGSILHNPGSILYMPVETEQYLELLCNVPLISLAISLSFNLLLLILCAIFGFLTRHLPKNFNESWYIFISVSTTLFIWVAFLPTYIMAFYAYHKAALLALALILNATVTIFCLFAPKIYAIFWVDEKSIKITDFTATTFETDNTQVGKNEA